MTKDTRIWVRVNGSRKKMYKKRAEELGISLSKFAVLAMEEQIKKSGSRIENHTSHRAKA